MNKPILFISFAIALFWTSIIAFAQEQAPAPSFKEGDTSLKLGNYPPLPQRGASLLADVWR